MFWTRVQHILCGGEALSMVGDIIYISKLLLVILTSSRGTDNMVSAREKLTSRFSGSVFNHVLETQGATAVEEVHERNFRDIRYTTVPAFWYVHCLFEVLNSVTHETHSLRFLISDNMWYLPEVGNEEEERMLGIFPIHFYFQPDLRNFSMQQLYNGAHLRKNKNYMKWKYFNCPSEDELYFIKFSKILQK